ncbi:hypothetical protein bpuCAU1_001589 (plasmid) [Borrelia puertoricensis]|uniref:hypothetical protein n=1 Tax=Borrelia puertoricensis TaxID=2756107 RepID=UPI003EB9B258
MITLLGSVAMNSNPKKSVVNIAKTVVVVIGDNILQIIVKHGDSSVIDVVNVMLRILL